MLREQKGGEKKIFGGASVVKHCLALVMLIINLQYWYKTSLLCVYMARYHREEPPQNPNKSAKKCSFLMGIFTWLKPKLKNRGFFG